MMGVLSKSRSFDQDDKSIVFSSLYACSNIITWYNVCNNYTILIKTNILRPLNKSSTIMDVIVKVKVI